MVDLVRFGGNLNFGLNIRIDLRGYNSMTLLESVSVFISSTCNNSCMR